jgi:hypothetical protein
LHISVHWNVESSWRKYTYSCIPVFKPR